jgi:hypothetical protein
MTPKEIEALWKDPRNRKWGIFYYCKQDPRVIVPKHVKWAGWTVNAARPAALPVTLFLVALVVVPVFIATESGAGTGVQLLTAALGIIAICSLCAYLSSQTE